jgi:hypothetical protein
MLRRRDCKRKKNINGKAAILIISRKTANCINMFVITRNIVREYINFKANFKK